jgi:hypothetical protein
VAAGCAGGWHEALYQSLKHPPPSRAQTGCGTWVPSGWAGLWLWMDGPFAFNLCSLWFFLKSTRSTFWKSEFSIKWPWLVARSSLFMSQQSWMGHMGGKQFSDLTFVSAQPLVLWSSTMEVLSQQGQADNQREMWKRDYGLWLEAAVCIWNLFPHVIWAKATIYHKTNCPTLRSIE